MDFSSLCSEGMEDFFPQKSTHGKRRARPRGPSSVRTTSSTSNSTSSSSNHKNQKSHKVFDSHTTDRQSKKPRIHSLATRNDVSQFNRNDIQKLNAVSLEEITNLSSEHEAVISLAKEDHQEAKVTVTKKTSSTVTTIAAFSSTGTTGRDLPQDRLATEQTTKSSLVISDTNLHHSRSTRINTTYCSTPQSHSQSLPSKNVLHQLLDRAATGGRKVRVHPPPVPYKTPLWFDLEPPVSSSSQASVRRMAWDHQGILLAVLYEDKRLCIYDWDTAGAVDIQGRNQRLRSQQPWCMRIPPILTIPLVSPYISSLQWNPFNPDEIAVYFWERNRLEIYDLGLVAAWQQGTPSTSTVPHRTLQLPICLKNMPASSQFLFVDAHHVIMSSQEEVMCLSMPQNYKSQVVWQYKWNKTASMAIMKDSLLLLANRQSQFIVVDWKQVERGGSFSSKPRPKVVIPQWNGLANIQCPVQWMDACNIKVRVAFDRCRVTWTTPRGWVLCSTLSLTEGQVDKTQILHTTAPVKRVLGDKCAGIVAGRWSEPVLEVASDFRNEWICWGDVAPQSMILSTHDRYTIGDGQTRMQTAISKPRLLLRSEIDGTIRRIPLSKRRGDPTCIAIHPNGEWILVGTKETGVEIMNARRRAL